MKKTLTAFIIIATMQTAFAQVNSKIGMAEAKTVINKTNEYIFNARKELRAHHVYSGDFSHAVRHQRFAIQMFKDRSYVKAFYHSITARFYALQSRKANTGEKTMFITLLSDIEQRVLIDDTSAGILIDDTSAGIAMAWPGNNTTIEKRNAFFVNIADRVAGRDEIDHVGVYVNKDKDFEDGDLGIENQ